MSKKQGFFIVLICVFFSWLFTFLFGRTLSAKISTWPVLNRWHLLSPDAPIVINNRETVRVPGSADLASAASSLKSKISAVVLVNNNSSQITGNALNLTSDGNFVTGSGSFPQAQGNYYVVLDDGHSAKISNQVIDPATSLIFFKAEISGVPVISFAGSKDISAGDPVLFASASFGNFATKVLAATVSASQNDVPGQIFQADYPRRGFIVSSSGSLQSGEGLFSTGSDDLGIWSGKEFISSDVLKQAVDLYLSNNQKISRPAFGFSYQIIGDSESALTGEPVGALVKVVAPGSAAQKAGLLDGDVITKINNKNTDQNLEQQLQAFKSGDTLDITVSRNKTILNLKLTAGELK